jgi:MFS family permease
MIMISTDLIRGAIAFVVAWLIWADLAPMTVFVLATISSLVASPFRPAVASLLPKLVRTPEELTAANGTSSTIESLAFFVGPALGGALLAFFDVPVVVVFNGLTFVWSALLVSRIRVIAPEEPTEEELAPVGAAAPDPEPAEVTESAATAEEEGESFLKESMAGFRTIWAHPDLRLVTGVYSAQTVVAGAGAVFSVEMAVQMTDFGSKGIGYLDSMMGVGALLGGLLAISRASAGKLATDFGVGVVFWAIPLLLTAVWPQAWAAFLAMFIIGVANPIVDVNAATILQRSVADEVMGRVFGALDAALIGAMAVGAAAMPLVINLVGLQWSLAILALLVTASVLPAFGRFRTMDRALAEPESLVLLRGVPLFAPLDAKSLESIAGKLVRIELPAGQSVIREGEEGDRFYVIESGALTATFKGDVLSQMGPGDPFGEIALLRDVPRTATVTADEDSVLLALERQDFLDAISDNSDASMRADDLIARRIPTY